MTDNKPEDDFDISSLADPMNLFNSMAENIKPGVVRKVAADESAQAAVAGAGRPVDGLEDLPLALERDGTPIVSKAPLVIDKSTKQRDIQRDAIEVRGNDVLVPKMSSEEVEARDPAWNKPMVRIKPPAGVSAEMFRRALGLAYHEYVLDGVVTADHLRANGISHNKIGLILGSPEFKRALQVRGIEADGFSGMTAEMDYALQVLLDPHDGLTMSRKLKKAGINNTKYRAFLKNPLFAQQLNRASEMMTTNNHEALVQLNRLVGEGELPAIKYYFELNNRYNPQREAAQSGNEFVNMIFEVISSVVKDPAMLDAIVRGVRERAAQQQGNGTPRLGG